VPHTAPPLAAKSRSGSKRFHRRQMFAIVVDCGSFRTSDDIGVEFKGVRSGVERRRGRGLNARDGRGDAPGEKVLKDRRSPRQRGRMGTSV
jgi:hypothetical protein